jgi:hypothetical protein
MSRGYYIIKNQQEYEELIKTPRKEFKYDKIRILVAKRNKKMRELLENRCYFNGDKKIEGKEYLEFHYFLRKYTYYFGFKSKEENEMAGKILEKRGNWRPYNPKKDKDKVDFMYIYADFKYDKRLFSLKCLLKNVTIKRGIKSTDKNILFEELEKIPSAKEYLVGNYYVNLKNMNMNMIRKMFEKYDVLIFKPIHGWSGIGVEVFESFQKFYDYVNSDFFKKSLDPIKKKIPNKDLNKFNDWVLQEYINNPMLIDGKKFHIRGYSLVHQEKKYILRRAEIFSAGKNYKKEDYQNKNIHDTHLYRHPDLLKFYPEDLGVNQKIKYEIQQQMENLFHLIGGIDKVFNCYSESKDCYQVFGFDVMITNDYQVKIIEINENPRLPSLEDKFGKYIFENEIRLMVDPIFPPKNKVEEESDFIQVY